MKPALLSEVAPSAFSGNDNPFGTFSPGSEPHRTLTISDAVRRCLWIAVDVNAAAFGLYFVGPSSERALLVPCFDSAYPAVASHTRQITGDNNLSIVKHARNSTAPCWWSDGPASTTFEHLDWAEETSPLVPGASGIAFPVYADRGQCGLVVFLGDEIALPADSLFDVHSRCFALFNEVARIRSGESGKFPSISKRELECLKLAANGYTSEEIARLLTLSVHTANQYLTSTTQKLDAVNRMHAIAKALRMGLIE